MNLSLSELEAVAGEIEKQLSGAVFRDLRMVDAHTVILALGGPRGEQRILVSLEPERSRIYRTRHPFPGRRTSALTPFEARVFRELRGAVLERAEVLFRDRVVALSFSVEGRRPSLIFECSGHHPNLFLADERRVIRSVMATSRSTHRDLRQGKRYQRPERRDERVEALRFLPDKDGISVLLEAHYDAESKGRKGAGDTREPAAPGRPASERPGPDARPERKPFRTFHARDGSPILVGRGGEDDLRTTFGEAHDQDLWFRAESASGPHVILPGGSQTIPFIRMLDAALLAVHFSGLDPSREVTVLCTHRRNVRREVRDPSGIRIVRSQRIQVRPDAERVKRLLGPSQSAQDDGPRRPPRDARPPARSPAPPPPASSYPPSRPHSPSPRPPSAQPPRPPRPTQGKRRMVPASGSAVPGAGSDRKSRE